MCPAAFMQPNAGIQFVHADPTMQQVMWIPTDGTSVWVPAQIACFAMPDACQQVPQVQSQLPESLNRKSKKTRSSKAPAVNKDSRGRQSTREPILPAPVKPLPEPSSGEPRTTVMLRNMPNNYNRAMLIELLDSEGFAGQYDFLYLPVDFQTRACLGYAFINLVSPTTAMRFWRTFDGYSRWAIPSRKQSGVSWSGPHQGLEAHVERYRNSPVMADSMPDEYKPAVFMNGVRVPFPPPTKKLKALRLKECHPEMSAAQN
jgi:hypothetical protein